MRSLLLTSLLTALLGIILACQPGATGNSNSGGGAAAGTNGSPTEAYKQLYAAVKSKDIEKIKATMSKSTQAFAQMVAARQNSPIEKVFENGFTGTTFAPTLPDIRDERVNCNMGAVEVWNAKEQKWEDLPFMIEDGQWKLAIGELFKGAFNSPGKGLSTREAESANATRGNVMPPVSNVNTNKIGTLPQSRNSANRPTKP